MVKVNQERSVLVVDTDKSRLAELERQAIRAGLSIVTASSFEAARQRMRHAAPAVLVAALRLGAYNGLHLSVILLHDHPESDAIVFCESRSRSGEIGSIGARFMSDEEVLQSEFWHSLAATQRGAAAVSPGLLRASA